MDKQIASISQGEPVGVGGWLFFFCLGLMVFTPLVNIVGLFSSYQEASLFFQHFPRFHIVAIVDVLLSIGIICFGIFAGVALLKQTYNAVRLAKWYLSTLLLYPVVGSLLLLMTDLPSEANSAIISATVASGFRPLVFFAIWYSYLNKSLRVRNTFQPMESTLWKRTHV